MDERASSHHKPSQGRRDEMRLADSMNRWLGVTVSPPTRSHLISSRIVSSPGASVSRHIYLVGSFVFLERTKQTDWIGLGWAGLLPLHHHRSSFVCCSRAWFGSSGYSYTWSYLLSTMLFTTPIGLPRKFRTACHLFVVWPVNSRCTGSKQMTGMFPTLVTQSLIHHRGIDPMVGAR